MLRCTIARYGAWALLCSTFALAGCEDRGFGRGFRTPSDLRTDEFVQLEPSRADVLWVVDSSCSMEDEQRALAENFPSFIEFFIQRRLDFHIAVTSTNIDEPNSEGLDGRFAGDPPVLDETHEDVSGAFLQRALLGIDLNHGSEKGLQAAYTAIEELGDGPNRGFLRDNAHLAIIVVSDEPDFSERDDPRAARYIDWERFSTWLDGLKGPTGQRMTDLSAIVGVGPGGFDDPEPCGRDEEAEGGGGGWGGGGGEGALRGDGYLEAVQATGGMWLSICEEDWGDMMGRVGMRAAGLLDTFPLVDRPRPETLQVLVDGLPSGGWEYWAEANSIRFITAASIPRPGQEVRVRYRVPTEEIES